MPEQSPESSFTFWKRLAVGALMVVACTTAATAAFGVSEVESVIDQITKGKKIDVEEKFLDRAQEGEPQTILLIGSDTIGKGETEIGRETARSDSIILVRLDPKRKATAVLSLPRDLRVEIPGFGTDKINAAYSLGGAELTLQTVKAATGLPVNHVVNVDFGGFTEVVDALGCVYLDIDRRYYNDSLEYTPIDLQPGYQRLCGLQALAYARYRHDDTDIVRAGRQQDFLRAFRDQLGLNRLIEERKELVTIFQRNTESDISERADAANLLTLAIGSAVNPIEEIHPDFTLEPEYVTSTPEKMQEATADFLGVRASEGPRGTITPADTPNANATGAPTESGGKRSGGGRKPNAEDKRVERASGNAKAKRPGQGPAPAEQKLAALEDSSVEGQAQAEAAKAAGADFPVCYPTLRTTGSIFAEAAPRVYKIGVGDPGAADRERFSAYRMVIKRGGIGEFYGIQGTTWQDAQGDPSNPPILGDPTKETTVNGRKFEVHYDGDRVRLVAWRNSDGVYWVANTLLQTLSAKEMLKIAGSTRCL